MNVAAVSSPSFSRGRWMRFAGPDQWSRLAAWTLALLAILDLLDGGIGALHAATAVARAWSPGVVVHALDPHLRTALLALAAWAFVREQGPRVGETTTEHVRRAADGLARGGSWVVAEVGLVLVLAGYRDVMRGELFAARYGEAQFVGSLSLSDVLAPATLALAAAAMVIAMARWAGDVRTRDTEPLSEPSRTVVPNEIRWIGLGLLLGCAISVRHYLDPSTGSSGGNARVALIDAWQCFLVGVWLLGAEWPSLSRRGIVAWLARGWSPITLVVLLEALRVALREDGPRPPFAWLAGRIERTPDALSFLTGRIHDWTGIVLAGVALGVTLAIWLVASDAEPPAADP